MGNSQITGSGGGKNFGSDREDRSSWRADRV